MNKPYKRNLPPKIIAILFSLLLWVYVMSAINPRITSDISNVPIQLINIDEVRQQGLVIVGDEDYKISARLSGRRDEVQRITRDQIVAKADLKGYRVGTNNIPVEVFVDGQADVEFSPKFITVELEEIVKRQKDVEIVIEGNPADGFIIGDLEFNPTVVWVEGPESTVDQVNRVVGKLKVEKEMSNITQSLKLIPETSKGVKVDNVGIQTQFADVALTIDQLKKVNVTPRVTFNPAAGYAITNTYFEPESVFIKGQKNAIANVVSIYSESREINNITENKELTIPLELPEGIGALDSDSIKVRVVVDKISERKYSFRREDIVINNIQSGFVVDINSLPENLEVRFMAGESIIQSLEGGELNVSLDVSGLQAGSHSIKPVLSVPNNLEGDLKGVVFNPQSINIRIIPKG